jgi:putative chitinase
MAIHATIDYEKFIASYGAVPSAFSYVFSSIKTDKQGWSTAQAAYLLATVKHETANTFQPIEEFYPHPQTAAGLTPEATARAKQLWIEQYFNGKYEREPQKTWLGNVHPGDGYKFRGRGLAQITGLLNYTKFSSLLHIDLVANPDLALKPEIAYQILSIGSAQGTFTGKRLSDYINESKRDWLNARRVINGTDRAAEIAAYAQTFHHAMLLAIQ